MMAVPPVLPLIRSDLGLSFAAAGALASLPLLCLGAAAIPGAILVNRYGASTVIGFGLAGIGVGSLLRLAPPTQFEVFVGTLVLSIAAALCQPAAASFIRARFAGSVQQATAIYTVGINTGSLAATSLTGFLLVFGGWRGTFVIWAIPPLLLAALWFILKPPGDVHVPEPRALGPLVKDRKVWVAIGLFGAQSTVYLTSTTWIPFLFAKNGTSYVAAVLFVLGAAAILPSVVLFLVRRPVATSRRFHVGTGVLMLLGTLGLSIGIPEIGFLLAALIGIGAGLAFTTTLALPPILASHDRDVAAFSGLMFTGGYAMALLGPLLGGVLLDHTGRLNAPFWPALAASCITIVVGLKL
jgi:MFS transporter, CP family, cyanate transporter